MSIINNYVDANIVLGKLASNSACCGGRLMYAYQSFTVASTDDAGSIYRVFKGLSPDIIVKNIRIFNEALTGASNVGVGLYKVLDYDLVGAVINATLFAATLDLSSAHAVTSAALIADGALTIAQREQPLWQVAGEAQYPAKTPAYDLCLTMTAMTTGATGAVGVQLEYVQL